MSVRYPPLTRRNFNFHLKKASSLLKNAIHREALHTPHPWQAFLYYLEKVTGEFDFSNISIMKRDNSQIELIDLVYTSCPEDSVAAFIAENHFQEPLLLKLHAKSAQQPAQCFSISEVVHIRDYQKTVFYNEYAYPYKVDSVAQLLFPIDDKVFGNLVVFPTSGRYEIKPIAKSFLSALVEDIGMTLNHRCLLQRLQAVQASLNRLNLGVILLNERGFVELINDQAKAILNAKDPLFISHNRLYTTDPGDTEKLNALCHRLLRGETRQREHQLILKSRNGKLPLQLMALSLEDKVSENLTGGYVPTALFINHPDLSGQLSINLEQVFQEFYGCGKKQAQVATLFTKGCSETEIAKSLNIGKETVRSHLNQVSEKLRDRVRSPKRRKQVFWDAALQHQWPLRKN